jgi:hypothetical protein
VYPSARQIQLIYSNSRAKKPRTAWHSTVSCCLRAHPGKRHACAHGPPHQLLEVLQYPAFPAHHAPHRSAQTLLVRRHRSLSTGLHHSQHSTVMARAHLHLERCGSFEGHHMLPHQSCCRPILLPESAPAYAAPQLWRGFSHYRETGARPWRLRAPAPRLEGLGVADCLGHGQSGHARDHFGSSRTASLGRTGLHDTL